MKYKIVWLEYTESTGKELKEFMEGLPNPKITGGFCDGTNEIECYDTFEVKDLDEAKNVIKNDYYEVEVFTLLDDNGNRVITEEDMGDVK